MEKETQTKGWAMCNVCMETIGRCRRCAASELEMDGQYFIRIRAGSADDYNPEMGDSDFCPDCYAGKNQCHHPGCKLERCPICHGYYHCCDCTPDGYILERIEYCPFSNKHLSL